MNKSGKVPYWNCSGMTGRNGDSKSLRGEFSSLDSYRSGENFRWRLSNKAQNGQRACKITYKISLFAANKPIVPGIFQMKKIKLRQSCFYMVHPCHLQPDCFISSFVYSQEAQTIK